MIRVGYNGATFLCNGEVRAHAMVVDVKENNATC